MKAQPARMGDFRSQPAPRRDGGSCAHPPSLNRETALRAGAAFGLGKAGVDLLRSDSGAQILEVTARPDRKRNREKPRRIIVGMDL